MADLRDIYQEVILEHAKSPRNYRALGTRREGRGLQPAVRRPLHRVHGDAGRGYPGHCVPRLRLRHFEGVGVDDDAKP